MVYDDILNRLPPIQNAIARLHLDTREWLAAAGVRRPTIDRIDRATMRASLAVELAQDGSRKAANLRRARDAMITYLNQVRFLCLHNQLDAQQFDEAERRVEQIRDGLADLERLELAKWPEHQLRPLRPLRSVAPAKRAESTVAPPSTAPKDSPGADSSRPDLSAEDSLEDNPDSDELASEPLDGASDG